MSEAKKFEVWKIINKSPVENWGFVLDGGQNFKFLSFKFFNLLLLSFWVLCQNLSENKAKLLIL